MNVTKKRFSLVEFLAPIRNVLIRDYFLEMKAEMNFIFLLLPLAL